MITQLKLSVLSLVQTTVGFGNLVSLSTKKSKLINDLQKSDCYSLNSERKKFWKVLSYPWHVSSYFWPFFEPCWSIFFCTKLIFPYFSSPRGVLAGPYFLYFRLKSAWIVIADTICTAPQLFPLRSPFCHSRQRKWVKFQKRVNTFENLSKFSKWAKVCKHSENGQKFW